MTSTITDRLDGLTTSIAVKAPCRVATTANVTLSGLQTINGVTVAADDSVLVKDQTTASENGIYVVSTGAWVRRKDFNGSLDAVKGTMVFVHSGTTLPRTFWEVSSSDPITIGTSSISFTLGLYVNMGDVTVSTRTLLKAVGSPLAEDTLYLTESNRDGWFIFDDSDLSTEVTLDTTEGVYVPPDSDATGASGAWVRVITAGNIDLAWFGPTGDGVADDTAVLNAALQVTKLFKGSLFITTGTFRITTNLLVYPGVKRVIGSGGIIKLDNSSGQCSLVLSTASGVHVTNCIIEGVVINANAKGTLGIYGQNIRNCTIRDNHVYGLTGTSSSYGVFVKSFYTGAHAAEGNVIEGNLIEGQTVHASHVGPQIGIVVSGDWTSVYNGYADATAEWKATFTNIAPDYYAEKNAIRNNTVIGGRYGMELIAGNGCIIEGNHFSSNTRGISLQLRCKENRVVNNTVEETLSTGVGLGYSCFDNFISGNTITSTLSNSATEGALFAYVGCDRNRFTNNKVKMVGGSGPGYMLYLGVHCDENSFVGNECDGIVQRTYAAIESGWDYTEGNTSHRAEGGASSLTAFANTTSTENSFLNNTFLCDSAKPAFFIGQYIGASVGVSYTTIAGNRIKGSYSRIIEIDETNSGLVNNNILNANHHATTSSSGFLLTRGLSHFATFEDPKLVYTATYDPPSIGAAASATTTIAITGLALGDFLVGSFSLDLAGLMMDVRVSAADTAEITMFNPTGGAIDLGSGTLSVRPKVA